MDKNKKFDAIVIGAGPGGATIASLIAHEGKRVLVIDKNPSPGGRMMTVHRDGHYYEHFPLNLIPFAPSLFEKLEEITGKQVRNVALGVKDPTFTLYVKPDGEIVPLEMSKEGLKKLGIKSPFAMLQAAKVFKKLLTMPEEEIRKLNHVSARDYMMRQHCPEVLKLYVTAVCGEGAFEMSSDLVPASHMVRMLQMVTSKDHPTPRYYEGGVGGFFAKQLETVPENGGELLYSTSVKEVRIQDNRVVGVTTDQGEIFDANMVISDAGIRQTVRFLVGEQYFPKEYVERVNSLRSNLCDIGYRYFTTKRVLDYSTYVLFPHGCLESWEEFEEIADGKRKPEKNYIYMGTKSVFPTIGPEDGRQVIYAVMSCVPRYNQDFTPYLEYVEMRAKQIAPQLFEEGVIEHKEIMTLQSVNALGTVCLEPGRGGESYGVADAIGQADDEQPKAKTPIQGLYLTGNDVEGFGIGTHRAVDSAFKTFEKVKTFL